MRLWGKVASGMLLVFAAVSVVVAVVVPEMRSASMLAAVLMLTAALFGVPAIVRIFLSFTGDKEVLENGTAGSATITSLKWTGWRYNRYYPIVRFGLSVEAGNVYPVEIKQTVDPEILARLTPGVVVGVRVDPLDRKQVVIDWRQPVRGATGAMVGSGVTEDARGTVIPTARTSPWPLLRWIFLVLGVVFLRLSCEEGYYEKGGVRVEGVVLHKAFSPGTTSTGGSGSSPSRHSASYRFTTKEGRTLEGRSDVLPGMWRQLKEGDPVVVEYLPDSPDTNRIPEQRARSRTWTVMALVLLAASAVLFLIGRRQRLAHASR